MGSLTTTIHIGADIGQKHDPTALVVAELTDRATGRYRDDGADQFGRARLVSVTETVYEVRMMQRLTLGTSYPDVAARIVEVLAGIHDRAVAKGEKMAGAGVTLELPRLALFIDATGVGQPVVDIVARAVSADQRTRAASIFPLTFTHGGNYDLWAGRVGKAHLVSRLQALLQEKRIKLPPGHVEAEAMARELKDYEIKIDAATAADTYGAFKVGTHDDLVTALGLAVLDDWSGYNATVQEFSY